MDKYNLAKITWKSESFNTFDYIFTGNIPRICDYFVYNITASENTIVLLHAIRLKYD